MRIALLTALVSATLLAACQTATPYGPMDGQYGYSDQQIESDRYQVAFRGNSATPRETVEAFLLYRAAELTVANGADYFMVVERATDTSSTWRAAGHTPAVYGYYPYARHRFPYYSYGYPWAYDATYRESRRYEAHAYIKLFSGDKPEDGANVYDAREVLANLEPMILSSQASSG
ncbi:hypothetical protein D1227_16215 [Henriciella mobilis]|uniref:CC0125/CC1285 family lipoprotein n=1 Tax=Henriciella mobilis TaxID=2305467 RepID=UPI000E666232|nr:hypothetical protein [Henriciella mobilis]RIJ14241.1 hypothetical protein D1231_15820 [Henriciella mobilis]RIJ19928.1 hypothetical protein D1227_16215 [Henriciella mobilis]